MMNGWEILKEAGELEQRGQAFALATVVWRQGPSSSQQGARAIITAGGDLHGWIGGACAEPTVIREAQRVIADGTPRLLLLGPHRPHLLADLPVVLFSRELPLGWTDQACREQG